MLCGESCLGACVRGQHEKTPILNLWVGREISCVSDKRRLFCLCEFLCALPEPTVLVYPW
jgi:hypothetical protein